MFYHDAGRFKCFWWNDLIFLMGNEIKDEKLIDWIYSECGNETHTKIYKMKSIEKTKAVGSNCLIKFTQSLTKTLRYSMCVGSQLESLSLLNYYNLFQAAFKYLKGIILIINKNWLLKKSWSWNLHTVTRNTLMTFFDEWKVGTETQD